MLTLKNVSKSFPSQESPTLKNINLSVNPGEFCVVIGNNGSGKSTLMRIISGEYRVDKGEIYLNNQDITKKPLYQRATHISSVTQDVNKGTVSSLTLLENMVLSLLCGHKSNLSCYLNYAPKIREILASLNVALEAYCDTPLSTLSGGQRQMVATLMAFSSQPQILLLDEHTSALDPKTHRILMEYTARKISEKGITTLMITHRLDDALSYGNRLIMLSQGEIKLDVRAQEKQSLRAEHLIELFHEYEDKNRR